MQPSFHALKWSQEYTKAAEHAECIKQVTIDLSELESRRLTSCQKTESLEQKLQELSQSRNAADDDAASGKMEAELNQTRFRWLFALQRTAGVLVKDSALVPSALRESLSELEERFGFEAEVLCKDILETLGDCNV